MATIPHVHRMTRHALAALLGALVASGATAQSTAVGSRQPGASDVEARWAAEQVARLPLEKKVAQMFWEPIQGDYIAADDPRLSRWLSLARDHGIGGFVLYGGTPQGVAHLLNSLQEAAALPLLVSADFEGGPGQQLAGATEFPANMALAAIGSDELAYAVGRVGAKEGRAVGIHLTYSPVVDVQTRPENPGLGVRSFGADLGLLRRLSAAVVRGYQENGMLATAKHYPGRGDVELIPGTEFTVNRKPAERVIAEDLAAFEGAIQAGVAFVMSEHIAVPALSEGSDLPASMNRTLATHWLRERLGFQGVLTSDDLWYPKITKRFGAERACVLSIQAGHDALLKAADTVASIAAVTAAVRAGEISEAQIDASVRKLLYWKARLGLHRSRIVDVSRVPSQVGIREHRELLTRIADESLTLVSDRGFFPSSGKLGRVVHVSIQRKEREPAAAEVATRLAAAFSLSGDFHIGPNTDPALREKAVAAARDADTILVSLFSQRRAHVDNGALAANDRSLIAALAAARPASTIVMSYGNPYLAADAAGATAFCTGYGEGGFSGNQLVYADSLIRLLRGEIKPHGRLPVSVAPGLGIKTGVTY